MPGEADRSWLSAMTLAREQRETALRSRRFGGTFGSVDFRGESRDFRGVSRVDLENEPIFFA